MSNLIKHAVLGVSYKQGHAAGREHAKVSRRGKLDSAGLIRSGTMKTLALEMWGAEKAAGWTRGDELLYQMLVLSALRDMEEDVESSILEHRNGEAKVARLREHAFEAGFVDAMRFQALRAIKKRYDDVPDTMEDDIDQSPRQQMEIILLLLPGCRTCGELVDRFGESSTQWTNAVQAIPAAARWLKKSFALR